MGKILDKLRDALISPEKALKTKYVIRHLEDKSEFYGDFPTREFELGAWNYEVIKIL